jgi:hypothetical protein
MDTMQATGWDAGHELSTCGLGEALELARRAGYEYIRPQGRLNPWNLIDVVMPGVELCDATTGTEQCRRVVTYYPDEHHILLEPKHLGEDPIELATQLFIDSIL